MSHDLYALLTLFGGLSLISIGGVSVLLPTIQQAVVERNHWMSLATFSQLFAISQAAPGPNVMLASIIGWHVVGGMGLLIATLAIVAPPAVLALTIGRLARRTSDMRWYVVLTAALVPLALGLMLSSGLVATVSSGAGLFGFLIAAGSAAWVIFTRRNPLIAMIMGVVIYVSLEPFARGV